MIEEKLHSPFTSQDEETADDELGDEEDEEKKDGEETAEDGDDIEALPEDEE